MLTKEIRSLLKHSSIYGIGTMAGQAAGLLLLPLYTRYLTPADYGIAAIIELIMALVGMGLGSSILSSMARFYHEYDNEAARNCVVSTMYWIIICLSVLSFSVIVSCAEPIANYLFDDYRYASLINIAAAGLAVGLVVDTGLLYLMVRRRSLVYVTISLGSLASQIALNIWFIVLLDYGLEGIFYSTLITRVAVAFFVSLPVLFNVGLRLSHKLAIDILRFSFPMIFSGLFRLGANESDKYFINYFFSPFETGIYAIATKVGTAVHTLITTSFLRSYNPTRFEIMKQHNAPQVYANILNWYLLIVVTAGFVLSLFSAEIIVVMTTERFWSAADYIPLIVLAWVIFGIRYHFETGILIAKKTKYFAYINGGVGLLSIMLNYCLIQRYQIWGAVLALTISQVVATVVFFIWSRKCYYVPFDARFMAKLGALAISLYVAATSVHYDGLLSAFALKGVIMVFYAWSLYMLGLIDDTTVFYIKEITKKAAVVLRVSCRSQAE